MDYMLARLRNPLLLCFILMYALLSVYVMQRFIITSNFGDNDWRSTLNAMINGKANRPFAYRVLTPKLISMLISVTPSGIQASTSSWLQNGLLADLACDPAYNTTLPKYLHVLGKPTFLYQRIAMMIVTYGMLWAYIVGQYHLAKHLFPGRQAAALFAPVIGLLLPPAFTYPAMMINDFSVLALSAACYYFMAQEKWKAYLVCFTLACLNKETALYLVFFYMFYFHHRLDAATFRKHLLYQALIYACIRMATILIYRNNPGDLLEDHLGQHMGYFFVDYNYRELINSVMFFFLLTFRWREKPLFARNVFCVLPIMYVAYIFFGFPGEYRVFFDIFPLITLLITDTLVIGTGLADAPLFNHTPRAPLCPPG